MLLDMKTDYEYLVFQQVPTKGSTTGWCCNNKRSGITLGFIKWYGPWRSYCYFALVDIVYSKGCLSDIVNFIDQLMKERKNG